MQHTIKHIFKYLQSGFYSPERSEEAFKIYLIYTFSLIGFLFSFTLGLAGVSTSNYILTSFLLGGSLILCLNIYYLKITGNHRVSSNVFLYLFIAAMIYLVYSGGVHNTGPLWIYSLPALTLFIHGLKKGLIDTTIFLLIISIILFYPNDLLLEASYSHEFKVRLILSLILTVLLSSVYEYSRMQSFLKMQQLREALEYVSTRDSLTTLYNRRGGHDQIEKLDKSMGAVLMCDIDHFKKINDTYGHYAGDFILKEVAKTIKDTIRKGDIAVRWGGEEFFIFLPKTNIDNGYTVAEKIRKHIENFPLEYNDSIINVTISIGVAEVNKKIDLEEAIRNADDSMYLSKAKGRNITLMQR